MRLSVLAGFSTLMIEVATQVTGIAGHELLVEILLAALVGLLTYIARETHKHSICLFGVRGDADDEGLQGDIKSMKKWKDTIDDQIEAAQRALEEVREKMPSVTLPVSMDPLPINGTGIFAHRRKDDPK